jgi:hypothetical protein
MGKLMKITKLFSFLAAFAVAFIFLACDNGGGSGEADAVDASLNGTWTSVINREADMKFNNGDIEFYDDGIMIFKGTYSTTGDKIKQKITDAHGDYLQLMFDEDFNKLPKINVFESKWYTNKEQKAQVSSKLEEIVTTWITFISEQQGEVAEDKTQIKLEIEEEWDNRMYYLFLSSTDTYSIENNKLTLTDEYGASATYTRE